jgi:site-specific DNA recombinase
MRVAVYIRVSTEEQAREGYSIGAQRDRITKFIESQGWEISDFYIDEGFSAKNLDRPAMQRLIKDANSNKFDVVVFYKLDRLVRSVTDLHELLQIFESHNIAIRSVSEIFDTTTAIGRLFITMVAAMAQWERETIAERVVEGMTKKALTGERNGGKPPFGYTVQDGELVVNPKEAKIVKEMFRMYINGSGIREIVLYINQLGIGVRKDIRTVSRMLDNPVYCGTLRWNKNSKRDEIIQEENHAPIISLETFENVRRLRKIRTIDGKKSTSSFHFSGVLRCARCGAALSGQYRKQRDRKQYICINKKNYRTCNLPIFGEDTLTKVFLESMSSDDPDKLLSLIENEDHNVDILEDNTELIQEIGKELASIKKRKKNWLLALGNGTIDQEEYKEMVQDDNKKEKVLKEQLEEITPKESTFNREEFLSAIQHIPQLWEGANDYEKKGFISTLFDKILVDVPHDFKTKGPGKVTPVVITGVELKL